MKAIKKLMLLVFAVTTALTASAQKEASQWFFGKNAGLDFSTGQPKATGKGALYTEEGSASIADKNGNLLFYTNGISVWNKNHRRMPNGYGLMGHRSSSQAALIVPQPGNDSIFYIFTTDFQAQANGLRYTIVNLAKQNSEGDVISKNNLLLTPSTEKLTAIRHRNNRDIWVIGHRWSSDAFVAYLVTPEGLSDLQVTSHIGSIYGGKNRNAIGYLKASPDGNRIATSVWNEKNTFEIFNFDNATGILSDAVTLGPFEEAYGVEFSPDGSKLYGGRNGIGGGDAQIYQFNLAGGTEEAILASAVLVGNSRSHKIGALQLGPDGRIYVARKDGLYLGVINMPDAAGTACSYMDDGVSLAGRRSGLGLPNFMQHYYPSPGHLSQVTR